MRICKKKYQILSLGMKSISYRLFAKQRMFAIRSYQAAATSERLTVKTCETASQVSSASASIQLVYNDV